MTVLAYAYVDPYLEAAIAADSFGQVVDRVYIDHPVPTGERSALAELLQDCAKCPPAQVRVRQLGELGDSLADVVARINQLEAHGITLVAIDHSYTTTSIPLSEADPARLVAVAETVQTQHRSGKLQAGHARHRVEVLPPPGRAPYGYRRGRYRYALDRATAPAVKDFFENFILYGSIRGAARFLDKTYGKRISASTAQRWLRHPVYRGDSLYKDGRVIRDTHTPIISREEAAQVDRLLRRNRQLPPKTVSAGRSLAGLIQCQECQSKLKVSRVTRPRQPQEYLYLRPIACGRAPSCRAIAYESVLNKTIDSICTQFPQAVENLETPPVASIKGQLLAQVAQKEQTLLQLPALQQQGILDETTANLRRYTLRSELSELQQQLSQLPPENLPQIAQTLSTQEFWQDLSEAERRVYLREFIQAVWIVRQEDDWDVHIQFVF
jgi:DNA invertase Pin-like site-specific DNA recombinase